MLLTMEQMQYLEPVEDDVDEMDEERFEFVGQGDASDAEKEELKELDSFYHKAYGYHIIVNYKDLG